MELKLPLSLLDEDFKSEGILLVFPSKLHYSYQALMGFKKFYKDYVDLIPEEIEVTWIIKNKEIKQEIQKMFYHRKFQFLVIPEIEDIWCGDWVPLFVEDQNKNMFGVQFTYRASMEDEKVGQFVFNNYYNYNVIKIPLILDGGCFESNPNEFIIISKKIFDLNPKIEKEEITILLKKYFKVKDVFYFDYDSKLGHADTLFRGIKKDLFIYSVFENKEEDKNLLNLFKEIQSIYPNCKFHPIPNEISGEIMKDNGNGDFYGEESYIGNIMDFIIVGNYIIFPIFTERSKLAKTVLENLLPSDIQIIEFESENLENLYKFGGGLYCITTNY